MMGRVRDCRRIILVLTATLAAAASCSPPAGSPRVVRIIATDRGFLVPARVPAGISEVRLINQGRQMHEGLFTHYLTPEGRASAYLDSVRTGVEAPAFAEDVGGPGLVAPGDSTFVWMDLAPGRYGVTCWYGDHMEAGAMQDFEVVPSTTRGAPPPTDLTVRMFDYNYEFRGSWSAGSHRVLVENSGTEAHEFDPYRLAPGKTPEDFFRWIESHRPGPPPAQALGGSGTFMPGRRIWLPLKLTPGRYFAFCQMPAKASGRPHYQMGMVRLFEVK